MYASVCFVVCGREREREREREKKSGGERGGEEIKIVVLLVRITRR